MLLGSTGSLTAAGVAHDSTAGAGGGTVGLLAAAAGAATSGTSSGGVGGSSAAPDREHNDRHARHTGPGRGTCATAVACQCVALTSGRLSQHVASILELLCQLGIGRVAGHCRLIGADSLRRPAEPNQCRAESVVPEHRPPRCHFAAPPSLQGCPIWHASERERRARGSMVVQPRRRVYTPLTTAARARRTSERPPRPSRSRAVTTDRDAREFSVNTW